MKKYRCFMIRWMIIILCITASSLLYAEDDLAVIVAQIQPSVVVVLTYDKNGELLNQGNGFFINNDGDVITNLHILQGAAGAQIKNVSGKIYTVTGVLARDKEADLVRISVDIPPRLVYPLTLHTAVPEVGEQVIVIGRPSEADQKVSDGIIVGVCDIPAFGTIIKFASTLSPDYYCCPVVNIKGEFIGIVVPQISIRHNLNFAVHSKRAAQLLQGNNKALTEGIESGTAEWSFSAEGLCNNGIFHLAALDYTNSLRCFEQSVRKNPRYSKAYFYIGHCKDKLGQYSEAIDAYKRAIRVNPDFVEAYINLGAAYDKLKRFSEAIDIYKHILRIQPEDTHTLYKLGGTYQYIGRYTEAINFLKQAIRIKPDFVEAYSDLGLAYFNLERYTEAIEVYKHVINIRPDDASAYSMLGSIYSNQGYYAEAIDAFKQAIQMKPDDAFTFSQLGAAYEKLGNYQEAIEAFKQSLHINPDAADVYYKIGSIYDRLKRYKEAIDSYNQAIRIKSDDAETYRMLGMTYIKLKQYTTAIEVYKQAININPNDANIYYNLAITYGILGHYQEETRAYRRAIQIKPDFAEAHLSLGVTYLNHGNRELALEEYKILQYLDTESASVLFNLIFK